VTALEMCVVFFSATCRHYRCGGSIKSTVCWSQLVAKHVHIRLRVVFRSLVSKVDWRTRFINKYRSGHRVYSLCYILYCRH